MLEPDWETERCSLLNSDVWKTTILTAPESAREYSTSMEEAIPVGYFTHIIQSGACEIHVQ